MSDQPPKRPFLADKANPGQYLKATRETHPGLFKTPEERARDEAATAASMRNLERMMAQDAAEVAAAELEEIDSEEQAASQPSSDDSEYVPSPDRGKKRSRKAEKMAASKKAKVAEPESAASASETGGDDVQEVASDDSAKVNEPDDGQAEQEDDQDDSSGEDEAGEDVLGVNDEPWKVGEPKTQPLLFEVHNGPNGEKKIRRIRYMVNFNSAASVQKASKYRRNELLRSVDRHGLGHLKKRASMVDQRYTEENDKYIVEAHQIHARANNGVRVPFQTFVRAYNNRFPTENRSASALYSYISRTKKLRDMRASYPVA